MVGLSVSDLCCFIRAFLKGDVIFVSFIGFVRAWGEENGACWDDSIGGGHLYNDSHLYGKIDTFLS